MKYHLPFGIRLNKNDSSSYISKEEYVKLSHYATDNKIKLEGFKKFKGNIKDIMELIDDIVVIAQDFPLILDDYKSVVLSLDTASCDDDFSTTVMHIVYLNASLYNDIDYLKSEYELAVEQGKFVQGTDYHSVIRHEIGHVVANKYKIDTMAVAQSIFPGKTKAELIEYVKNNVSLYAATYNDGREFISECFSAYYSNVANDFEINYVKGCMEYGKGGNVL